VEKSSHSENKKRCFEAMKRLISVILILFFVAVPVYANDSLDEFDAVYANDFLDGFDAYEKKDYKTALEKFKPLAEQGYSSAQSILGMMYYDGLGIPQSYNEAVKWLRRAAGQGNAQAQYNLGSMYAGGLGVPQNIVQAYRWFSIAGVGGLKEGHKNSGIVEKLMTLKQITEGQRLVREWIVKHGKK
jgi:TPR repeat protein